MMRIVPFPSDATYQICHWSFHSKIENETQYEANYDIANKDMQQPPRVNVVRFFLIRQSQCHVDVMHEI